MGTLIEKRMKDAMIKKSEDITGFVWKGLKTLGEDKKYQQSETRLIDMSESELFKCYEHCKTMLYNKNNQNPGRYMVLDIISDQKNRCGVEMFLRFMEQENNVSRFTLRGLIGDFLHNNKETFKDTKPTISDVFSNLPNEFESISLDVLMDGCLDKLGVLNKKHITRTFVLRQGIWLTSAESKELVEYGSDGKLRDRLDVIRERFNLKPVDRLYINSKGLDYTQMRSMLGLKPNKKYADLTTTQLETLRNKILFNLEDTIHRHIASWETRMDQIEKVAEHNEIKL